MFVMNKRKKETTFDNFPSWSGALKNGDKSFIPRGPINLNQDLAQSQNFALSLLSVQPGLLFIFSAL